MYDELPYDWDELLRRFILAGCTCTKMPMPAAYTARDVGMQVFQITFNGMEAALQIRLVGGNPTWTVVRSTCARLGLPMSGFGT